MQDIQQVENDRKLTEIIEAIDNDFFTEAIKEQISSGLDCASSDHLTQFKLKIEQVRDKYQEEDYGRVLSFKDDLEQNIILWVEEKYGIDIYYEPNQLEIAARQVYNLFVIELKDIVKSFITSYIIENYENLIDSIGEDNLNTSFIPEIIDSTDRLKLIAAGNVSTLVDEIININIGFERFIHYAAIMGDSQSVEEINNGSHVIVLEDSTNVFDYIMKALSDNEFDHDIIISIYEMVISNFGFNKKQVSIQGDNYENNYDINNIEEEETDE